MNLGGLVKTLNTLAAVSVIIFSLNAFSIQKNPQIRLCNNLEGQFLVANTANDQVGLCQLGSAIIGAKDLVLFKDESTMAQSIQAYADDARSCAPYGQLQTIQVLEGAVLEVCSFEDGSVILNTTLEAGKASAFNQKLNQALEL